MVRPTVDTATLKHTCTNYSVSTINSLINGICCHLWCRAVFLKLCSFFFEILPEKTLIWLKYFSCVEADLMNFPPVAAISPGTFCSMCNEKVLTLKYGFQDSCKRARTKGQVLNTQYSFLQETIQRFANLSYLAKRWICSFLGRGARPISNKYSSSCFPCCLGSG